MQATLFFKSEHFKTSVPVAVTTMLVMYTLNNSVSSKLPPTSYIKLIDVWLLFGLIVPFLIIILLVIIEHMPKPSKPSVVRVASGKPPRELPKPPENMVVRFSRVYLPLLEVLFVIVYAAVASMVW